MRIQELYSDYVIPSSGRGKNCGPGWIVTKCPFCDDPSAHLGYSLYDDYFRCWRCGWKPTIETISKLLKVDRNSAKRIIIEYGGTSKKHKHPKTKIRLRVHKLPSGTIPLQKQHRIYLQKRGFDPDKLIHEWGLLGTGPTSMLDGRDYKHRILAPIFWENKQVSFQTRDITGKAKSRYKACPKDRELIHHKHILYGKQGEWKETGICVEGVIDAWRLGPASFAVFGINYTTEQIHVMAKLFKKVVVIFDNDSPGITQADKLISELRFRGVEAWRVNIEGDPGAMKQDEADYLVRQII